MGSLVIAGLFEIGWAIGLKYTDGFTRAWPSVGTGAILLFNEPATAGRIACVVLIVTGILGLKLTHVA